MNNLGWPRVLLAIALSTLAGLKILDSESWRSLTSGGAEWVSTVVLCVELILAVLLLTRLWRLASLGVMLLSVVFVCGVSWFGLDTQCRCLGVLGTVDGRVRLWIAAGLGLWAAMVCLRKDNVEVPGHTSAVAR